MTRAVSREANTLSRTSKIDDSGPSDNSCSLEVRFAKSALSGTRRELLRAILDNHEETFFLSSREMAKRYSVDAATIVRSVQALGYERFAEFAADLRQHFVNHITPYTVLKAETQEKRSVQDQILHCLERDSESLSILRSSLDVDRAVDLAKSIHNARRILVVGLDLAATLAWFLAYGLTPLGFDAEAPVGTSGNLQHKIDLLTKKDLLIAISFGRCLKETVESVQRAHGREVPTFGITDSDTTPIAVHCDDYLLASTSSPSFTGSYVAPIALVNTIIVAAAHLQPKRALAMLGRNEEDYRTGGRWYKEPLQRTRSPNAGSKRGRNNNTKR